MWGTSEREVLLDYQKNEPKPNAGGEWRVNEVRVDGYRISLRRTTKPSKQPVDQR